MWNIWRKFCYPVWNKPVRIWLIALAVGHFRKHLASGTAASGGQRTCWTLLWLTRLRSNWRPTNRECVHLFSYAWSLPVTRQRWRSYHSICTAETPMLYARFMAPCFIEPELLPMEVLYCENRDFRQFLLLWPWPRPDDLHIRIWPVSPRDIWMCENELLMSRLSKVSHCSQCRQLQATADLSVRLSVRPSVRPSVIFRRFVQGMKIRSWSSASSRTIIVVSGEVKFIRIFAGGGHTQRGR